MADGFLRRMSRLEMSPHLPSRTTVSPLVVPLTNGADDDVLLPVQFEVAPHLTLRPLRLRRLPHLDPLLFLDFA